MSYTLLRALMKCVVCGKRIHIGACEPSKEFDDKLLETVEKKKVVVEDEQLTKKCITCGKRTYTDRVMYMCSVNTRFDQDTFDSFEYCNKCWLIEKFRRQSMCKRPYRMPGMRPIGGNV